MTADFDKFILDVNTWFPMYSSHYYHLNLPIISKYDTKYIYSNIPKLIGYNNKTKLKDIQAFILEQKTYQEINWLYYHNEDDLQFALQEEEKDK